MPAGILIAILCSLAALAYGFFTIKWVLDKPDGNEKMIKIASAIQEGSTAYFKRQYGAIALVGIALTIILIFALDLITAAGFVVGAILSSLAGFIGMYVSVRANVRTAEAAKEGLNPAMQVAFKSGAITGMLVVGLGLFGVAGFLLILGWITPRWRRIKSFPAHWLSVWWLTYFHICSTRWRYLYQRC